MNPVVAAVGAVGALAYLNAKGQVSKDVNTIARGTLATREVAKRAKANRLSPWFLFSEAAAKYPNHEALWWPGRSYSYAQAHQHVCQFAAMLQALGASPGDTVTLYMQNSPEIMFVWLAIWSLGCCPAFLNYNLTGAALLHTWKVSTARILVADADLAANLTELINTLEPGASVQILDADTLASVYTGTAASPSDALAASVTIGDDAVLMYTSGTSGLPKGTAFRFSVITTAITARKYGGLCSTPGPGGDRCFNCMPIYHGTGGITSMAALCLGITVCMVRKFSVSTFWRDVRESRATFFIYVGETARYLLANPPSPLDKEHNIMMMYGNGLRPDVWPVFKERFAIPTICEFYGATEAVGGLQLTSHGPIFQGAVGHHDALMRFLSRGKVMAAVSDPDTGELERDPTTGFVKENPLSEGGELLTQLTSVSDFQGYRGNAEATEKKLARNVRRKGDIWFRSGDALRRDALGRWYFMDRLGDTYRWKSENVSTMEVAAIVGTFPGVSEAVVYGVLVPRHDGRAGCARLHIPAERQASFDYHDLLAALREQLPRYAVPTFLRVSDKPAETTGNNKVVKRSLLKEGIDLASISGGDKILWARPGAEKYVELTQADYETLSQGKAKL